MKKYTLIIAFAFVIFILAPLGAMAEEPVPQPVLTKGDVAKEVKDGTKDLAKTGDVNKLVNQVGKSSDKVVANTNAVAANTEEVKKLPSAVKEEVAKTLAVVPDAVNEALTKKGGAIDTIGADVKVLLAAKGNILEIPFIVTLVALFGIGLVVVLGLIKKPKPSPLPLVKNELSQEFVENVKKMVNEQLPTMAVMLGGIKETVEEIPAKTATLVKKLDPITIEFDAENGAKVAYTPPIVNEMYVGLYVPKSVTRHNDPKLIPRKKYPTRGKLFNDTEDVVNAFIRGDFNGKDVDSFNRNACIMFAIGTDQLKIIEKTS